jgi:hypothetical protein
MEQLVIIQGIAGFNSGATEIQFDVGDCRK